MMSDKENKGREHNNYDKRRSRMLFFGTVRKPGRIHVTRSGNSRAEPSKKTIYMR